MSLPLVILTTLLILHFLYNNIHYFNSLLNKLQDWIVSLPTTLWKLFLLWHDKVVLWYDFFLFLAIGYNHYLRYVLFTNLEVIFSVYWIPLCCFQRVVLPSGARQQEYLGILSLLLYYYSSSFDCLDIFLILVLIVLLT